MWRMSNRGVVMLMFALHALVPLLVSGRRAGGLFTLLRDPISLDRNINDNGEDQPTYSWTEEWIELPVDHFAFADEREFELRYFINLTHYTPGGPIFFYTGNEGKLEAFAQNTGFMWDLAPEYKAAVVFAEHRFYGKSLPFGNRSFTDVKNLGYLSSEQALADFADVITHLKTQRIPDATHSPVILFGGSYGGMLATWFRVKYPHLCNGAIAGSAPVFWFRHGNAKQDAYAQITSRTFKLSGCNLKNIRASFDAMGTLAKTESGRSYLNKVFRLSKSSEFEHSHDYHYYMDLFSNVMGEVVMINYPYPTNFFQNVPAWPVREMCKSFKDNISNDPKQQVTHLYDILNVYYNNSGTLDEFCLRGKECGGDDQLGALDGWQWQVCTEMVMPICNSGPPNDVFDQSCPFSLTADYEMCDKLFARAGYKHTLYRPDWTLENYGADFPTATNIVFSNGFYDPWSAGGWRLEPATEGSLVSLIIEQGAHHYDLRAAHPNDTADVKEARLIEREHISRWIKEAKQRPSRQFKRQTAEPNSVHHVPHAHHRGHHHHTRLLHLH